ncbi:hypothetical protein ACFSSA_00615 [Luteolibacter algae]|uniref:Uncharacterized protein n=1 Tax=Luteolibacter algae TaxID=454151 RepID=A0ABW5D2A3_9BACT
MDFFFDNIIFFLAAAAGLVQWWKSTQEAKQEKLAEEQRREQIKRYLAEQEAGRTEVTAPRAAIPPPIPKSAPVAVVPEKKVGKPLANASGMKMHDELERQRAIADRLAEIEQRKRSEKTKMGGKGSEHQQYVSGPCIGVKSRLRNMKELRQAVVVKEILDSPVSLRQL